MYCNEQRFATFQVRKTETTRAGVRHPGVCSLGMHARTTVDVLRTRGSRGFARLGNTRGLAAYYLVSHAFTRAAVHEPKTMGG